MITEHLSSGMEKIPEMVGVLDSVNGDRGEAQMVSEAIAAGVIRSLKRGKYNLITRPDVDRFMASRERYWRFSNARNSQ